MIYRKLFWKYCRMLESYFIRSCIKNPDILCEDMSDILYHGFSRVWNRLVELYEMKPTGIHADA